MKINKYIIAIIFVSIFIILLVNPFVWLKKSEKKKEEKTSPISFNFGSGKEDLAISSDENLRPGSYEYKSVILEKGTIGVEDSGRGQGKLILVAQEKIVIKKEAKINLSGVGFKGAPSENKGEGAGKNFDFAGGGGSHKGSGGLGDCSKKDTSKTYGSSNGDESFGSGGGVGIKNNNGRGGNGGGFIKLIAPEIIIEGEVLSNGGNGQGSGGGGAGGKIVILGNKVNLRGKILANGGDGGTSQIQGAGGGGGGIIIFNVKPEGNGIFKVSGGKGGSALDIYTGCNGSDGENGQIYTLN